MPISLSDARYWSLHALGLLRRAWVSLRTRGWRATLQRAGQVAGRHLQRQPATAPLYLPSERRFEPFAVPFSAMPTASIVIPVYNHADQTLACLRALAEHPPRTPVEIIVSDDGSSDATQPWLARIEGLRYHRRTENGGFIAACNEGAALARGRYLVFLNNDTIPQPGWLDALLGTFADHPEAGLVGAKLVYPSGLLQEAGGVVFSDGSAWNYGRFDAPDDPRYSSLREADYCSGAALAIPAALFSQLGRFDARYAPAYYEDTDLAFAVRASGHRVLYQPAACVVHLEGVTAGTDTGGGIKAYQAINRAVFADKWRQALPDQLPPSSLPTPSRLHRGRHQVLLIDAQFPWPDRDSGSLRVCNLMQLLIREGAHVVFVPADGGSPDDPGLARLRALGVEVWHSPWLHGMSAWLREHGPRFDAVMLSHWQVAQAFMPLLLRHAPRARRLFDTVDLHYLRERRAAELTGDPLLLRTAERTRRNELRLVRDCDTTLVVSPLEKELLNSEVPDAKVEILSNLHAVAGTGQPFAQRHDLMFVGNFRHPPNIDAMLWFGEQVFPLLRTLLPGVVVHCIGAEPPPAVRALAQSEGIVVHGHVPDLTPYLDGVRVTVAPLRYGAGVKGKVNQSMAHGQPVVATPCAVEGMYLRDGEDVLIADTAESFAQSVARLYLDETLWLRLARGGRENVARHFSFDVARPVVRQVFGLDQPLRST